MKTIYVPVRIVGPIATWRDLCHTEALLIGRELGLNAVGVARVEHALMQARLAGYCRAEQTAGPVVPDEKD